MSALLPEVVVKTTKANGTVSDDQGKRAIWNWKEQFGRPVMKDDPIWANYVELAITHDNDVIEALSRSMDILLVFSGLFSAVVTTFIVQAEQALMEWDPVSYTATTLTVIFSQLDWILWSQNIDTEQRPTLEGKSDQENPYYPSLTVILWYVSLDCALLVAGGAVCMRQWLLEYRRSNSLNRAPYTRAIHHQESYAGLKRWYIPEFGDLLGTIVLVYLVLFFTGVVFHLSIYRTGNVMFWDIANVALGVYSAFLAFTIIVGIFVPSSPYKTPISNLIRRVPQLVFQKLIAHPRYTATLLLVLISAITTVTLIWIKTTNSIDMWFILLWVAAMVLTIGFGLRNGLKVGRISRFVPIMGIAIGILAATSLVIVTVDVDDTYTGISSAVLAPFTLVVILLSHRFSTTKGEKYFPTGALLFSAAGIVTAFFVTWRLGYNGFNWPIPLSGAIVWTSMMVLSARSLLQEGAVEEDTREAEALGWLITQAGDIQTLHSALACIPSIADTPLRRQIVLEYTYQTLALCINSLVDTPGERCLIGRRRDSEDTNFGGDGSLDRESQLMFYVACLAELSHGHIAVRHEKSSKRTSHIARPWISRNWYRLLTLRPAQHIFTRELRFLHDWQRPSEEHPSDLLRMHLGTLSKHKNTRLSVTSQAALFQLYPSSSLIKDISSWDTLVSGPLEQTDTIDSYDMLVGLRMVTTRVLDAYHRSKTLESSVLRFLYYYCYTILDAWVSARVSQDGSVFEAAMVLGYLVLENDSNVIGVTGLGDSTPMKAARCLMSLKRWHERSREGKGAISAMDKQLYGSFANSIASAMAKYLQLGTSAFEKNCRLIRSDEGVEVDENSIIIGMSYLEQALLQIAAQEWPSSMLDQIASALVAFYSIVQDSDIEFLPLDLQHDATSLMIQLKSRLVSSGTTTHDRVATIRTVSRILNKIPDPVAWLLAVDGSSSLPAMMISMAQEESVDCRVAVLSTLLDTRIFNPQTAIPSGNSSHPEKPKLSSLSSMPDDVRLDVIPDRGFDLVKLYSDIMNYSCLTILKMAATDAPLHRIFIQKTITITSLLADTWALESLPPTFFEHERYPMMLAHIASNGDIDLVALSTRTSALRLFVRLWSLSQGVSYESEVNVTDIFGNGTCLRDIKKAVELLVARRAGMGLDSISLWVDRLEEACEVPEAAKAVSHSGILEAFCSAVGWVDFGQPIEEDREKVFDRLIGLQERILSPDSGP